MNILMEESLCVQERGDAKQLAAESDQTKCASVGNNIKDIKEPVTVNETAQTMTSNNGTKCDNGETLVEGEQVPGSSVKRKHCTDEATAVISKKVKQTEQKPMPQFYFNLHKRQIKLVNLPR